MVLENNDGFILKSLIFFVYVTFLFYAYTKGRMYRQKRKEKKLGKRLQEILEIENLPLYPGEETINWHRAYTLLKKIPNSPEKKELLKEVQEKKIERKKIDK